MISLTPEQQAVVDSPVCNILVSAAAGSGKTRVLTDRIVQRILTGQTDVRSILVMTFTDMAARQMRDKIAEKLRDALTTVTDEMTITRIRRQLLLLPGALISTIHSFCLTVIRNFYYEARNASGEPLVLPDFIIDDGSESDILLQESMDTLLFDCHEAIDLSLDCTAALTLPEELEPHLDADIRGAGFIAAFYRLVDGYGSARGDEPLKDLIRTLYRYLRSMPDYADFVRQKVDDYAKTAADFTHSPAAAVLIGQLTLRLERAMTMLPELESMLDTVRFYVDRKKSDDMVSQYREAFACLRALHAGILNGTMDYNDLHLKSRPLTTLAAPRGGKSDSPEKQRFTELFCQYIAEAVYTAAGGAGQTKCIDAFQFDPLIVCARPSAVIEAELTQLLPSIRCLFAFVLALDTRYSAQKKQAGIIEFSDFEHLALAILRGAEAGAYYRSRIMEIYIDEYQDTSSIQEAIIASITKENCLMVGDVKQSIYRFRHARPQIFLDKHQAYLNGDGGALFELNRNFRSQAEIVDTVNEWFAQLMSEAVGEIRYDERHALVTGVEPEAADACSVRLLFLNLANTATDAPGSTSAIGLTGDLAGEPENNASEPVDPTVAEQDCDPQEGSLIDLTRDQKEAIMVAGEIRRLVTTGTSYGQIAILARTRQVLSHYASILDEFAIPIQEETEQPFLDSPILRLMEALVHLIDNRRQDIPLAAVMRSPLYKGGFSDDDLARIRLDSRSSGLRHKYFHEAVDWYAENGASNLLLARTAGFLAFLDELREKEPVLTIGELLDLIFLKTGFRDKTARLPDGKTQVEELDRFRSFTHQYEQRTRRGIYAFARYIERLHELDRQQSILPVESVSRDAVSLLSIHRSKGLEFPVVFIVGTAYQLNIREKNQQLLLSEQLGIGPDFVDIDRQVRYPTPLKQAMFEALKAKNRSEELRLLYVAMTRARRILYLTGCFQISAEGDARAIRLINTVRKTTGTPLPEYMVLAARSYQDWLLLALARNDQVDLTPLFGISPETPILCPLPDGVPISITFHSLAELLEPIEKPERAAEEPDMIEPDAGELGIAVEPDTAGSFSSALLLSDTLPEGIAVLELPDETQRAVLNQINNVILGEYPYPGAVRLPQKISVSELKRRAEQLSEADDTPNGLSPVHGIAQTVTEWTAASKKTLTASEIGTTAHQVFRFLELAPLVKNPSFDELSRQVDRLRAYRILSAEEQAAICPLLGSFRQFFASPLAARMCQAEQRGQLYREMPFTIAVPAKTISPEATGVAPSDRLLIQGMIDCWFRENGMAILIDFKTDRLSGSLEQKEEILRSRYRVQIDYYAQAIYLATGLAVGEKLIYSMQDARFIDLAGVAES